MTLSERFLTFVTGVCFTLIAAFFYFAIANPTAVAGVVCNIHDNYTASNAHECMQEITPANP